LVQDTALARAVYWSCQCRGCFALESDDPMGAQVEEMATVSVVQDTEGCAVSRLGPPVSPSVDRATVRDGPFTETKEHVGAHLPQASPPRRSPRCRRGRPLRVE
jgi:hypothetical protein